MKLKVEGVVQTVISCRSLPPEHDDDDDDGDLTFFSRAFSAELTARLPDCLLEDCALRKTASPALLSFILP